MNKAANKKYLIIFLFAFSFLLYARTINYNFVWDDERIHITSNEELMKGNAAYFWEQPYKGMYIPASYTAWIVIKKLATTQNTISPQLFHLVNVLLHCTNGILVFLLLLHLFKHQGNAFWGALLFLVHPLQVESVAWVSEFRGLLSTLFMLSAIFMLFLYIEKKEVLSTKLLLFSRSFFLASLLFILAMLSKPSAVILPFAAGILAWSFYKTNFKAIAPSLVLWLLLSLPILYITKQSQPSETIYTNIAIWQRVIIAGDVYFFYFLKLFFPYPLASCYGNTPEAIINNSLSIVTAIAVCCSFIFLLIKRNHYPMLFAGAAIIMVCILPVSGIVPFEYQKHATTADRYMYFAILGTTLWIPALTNIQRYKWIKHTSFAMLAAYILLNVFQLTSWKNEFTVWDHTLHHYQNSARVYYNRGVEYSKMQNYTKALADYSKSIELRPIFLDALFNRANAYENLRDAKSAFRDYKTYLSIDSSDGSVYFKRAYLLYRTGHITEAKADVQKAEQHHFAVDSRFKATLNRASN